MEKSQNKWRTCLIDEVQGPTDNSAVDSNDDPTKSNPIKFGLYRLLGMCLIEREKKTSCKCTAIRSMRCVEKRRTNDGPTVGRTNPCASYPIRRQKSAISNAALFQFFNMSNGPRITVYCPRKKRTNMVKTRCLFSFSIGYIQNGFKSTIRSQGVFALKNQQLGL